MPDPSLILIALAVQAQQLSERERSAYYRNCDAVRAAGKAPIYKGQPGYRPALDRDRDGIACEPYRGKRNNRCSGPAERRPPQNN